MSRHVRFLPEAQTEYDQAADWYEHQRPGLGPQFIARIREVIQRIALNPKLHAIIYKDVRKAVAKQFPFVVLYREENEEVIIVSVFHASRDPAIWQARADS